MECTEPFIQRDDAVSVVALEMFVMKVMSVGVGIYVAFIINLVDYDFVES